MFVFDQITLSWHLLHSAVLYEQDKCITPRQVKEIGKGTSYKVNANCSFLTSSLRSITICYNHLLFSVSSKRLSKNKNSCFEQILSKHISLSLKEVTLNENMNFELNNNQLTQVNCVNTLCHTAANWAVTDAFM